MRKYAVIILACRSAARRWRCLAGVERGHWRADRVLALPDLIGGFGADRALALPALIGGVVLLCETN